MIVNNRKGKYLEEPTWKKKKKSLNQANILVVGSNRNSASSGLSMKTAYYKSS
jgi:hypothetical protein